MIEDDYSTTADTLMSRLRGYGVTNNVSPIRHLPMTWNQYQVGVMNAAVVDPSLNSNGTFDSVFVVDTLLDIIDPNDGLVSLREAMIAANTFAGYNKVVFASGLTGTIFLNGTALPTITKSMVIEGPGAEILTIDAGHMSRIFNIMPEDPYQNAPIPAVPTGLSGISTTTGDGITLTWSASSDATGYAVYQRYIGMTRSNAEWHMIGTSNSTSFTDSGLLPNTTYEYFIIAFNTITGQMSTPSGTVRVTTVPQLTVGLHIDSNNTAPFAPPDFSQPETDIKNDPDHFGKLIPPNWGDCNSNGVLDCWDGFGCYGYYTNMNPWSSEIFVPIVVQIDTNALIDYANTTIMFDYAMYAMNSAGVTMIPSDRSKPPTERNGEIRIWTKNGHETRSGWNLSDNGHFVESGVAFTLEELGFVDSNGNLVTDTITLYAEGVSLSSSFDNTITVFANYAIIDGSVAKVDDTVRYAVAQNAIAGRITYTNNNDPVRHAKIEVINIYYDLNYNYEETILAYTYTNENGYYLVAISNAERPKIDQVRVLAESDSLARGRTVSVVTEPLGIFGTYQALIFSPFSYSPDVIIRNSSDPKIRVDCNITYTYNNGPYLISQSTLEAFYVYDAMVTAAQIHATLPDVGAGHVSAYYPWSIPYMDVRSFAYWNSVHITADDYRNWDTILHEYGHHVAQSAGFFDLDINIFAGNHAHLDHSGGNLRDEYDHACVIDTHLAFSEGWAHFYAAYAKQHKDAHLPSYVLPSKYLYDGSDPNNNDYQGEDHEMAVMQLFWDLYDDDKTNEFFDDISLGINGLYNLLRVNPKYNVNDVWHYFSNVVPTGPNYLDAIARYGVVFANHGMGVTNLSINTEPYWQQGDDLPTFYWDNKKTGWGTYHLFNRYYVEFYDSQGNMISQSMPISSSSNGPIVSWTPSYLRWNTIMANPNVSSDKKVYWVVRCSTDWSATVTHSALTTGLYWSDSYGEITIL